MKLYKSIIIIIAPTGLEPATFRLEGENSVQLKYRAITRLYKNIVIAVPSAKIEFATFSLQEKRNATLLRGRM